MKIFILILPLFLISNLFAETFFVNEPKIIGDNKDDLGKVVKELIIASIENNGHKTTDEATNELKLQTSLLKLGDSYILSVKKIDNKNSVSKKMKIKTLDDLDITISRIIKASLQSESVEQTLNVKEITKEEKERREIKFKVYRQWLLGLGPAWFSNLQGNKGLDFAIGYLWNLDYNFDLNLKYEWAVSEEDDNNAMVGLFSVGGNYFFTDSVHGPYAAIDLGYGFAENSRGQEKSGWGTSIGGGIKFFRASSVNFATEIKYTTIFENISDKMPGMFSFKIAIFF